MRVRAASADGPSDGGCVIGGLAVYGWMDSWARRSWTAAGGCGRTGQQARERMEGAANPADVGFEMDCAASTSSPICASAMDAAPSAKGAAVAGDEGGRGAMSYNP